MAGSCFGWKLSFPSHFQKGISEPCHGGQCFLSEAKNKSPLKDGWLHWGWAKQPLGLHFSFLRYFNLLILAKLFIILCTWLPVLQTKLVASRGRLVFSGDFHLYFFHTRVEVFPPICFKGCVKWIRQYYRYIISFVSVWNFNILSIFFAELALNS